MREKTFEAPTVAKILELNNMDSQRKLDPQYILSQIDEGNFIWAGNSYRNAVTKVEAIEKYSGKILLFPTSFGLTQDQINIGTKSLEWLTKIDSQPVLRKVSKSASPPSQFSIDFLEKNQIKPQDLYKEAFSYEDVEKPPIGSYWRRSDGHFFAFSFLRSATAAEMVEMAKRGDFPKAEIIDKTPYGKNMRIKVSSRTESEKDYPFTLSGLPIFKKGDPRQYSSWINLDHNSQDPDATYIGREHDKKSQKICWASTPVIFGYNEIMRWVRESGEAKQFRSNPFLIPIDKSMVDFIDNLRLRSLKITFDPVSQKRGLSILYKTEMDKIIGARTVLRGYDKCWVNWGGNKDKSYLYTPRN